MVMTIEQTTHLTPGSASDALTISKSNGRMVVLCCTWFAVLVVRMMLLTKLETHFQSATRSDPLTTSLRSLRVFVDTKFVAYQARNPLSTQPHVSTHSQLRFNVVNTRLAVHAVSCCLTTNLHRTDLSIKTQYTSESTCPHALVSKHTSICSLSAPRQPQWRLRQT
jgi:hypothetical protein